MSSTKGEIVNQGLALAMGALQMITRLRDHIERLDNGHAYAADDLAVVLRALLVRGQGNDVLQRTYDSYQLAIPTTTVSKPACDDPGVFFSVGAIPTEGPGAAEDGAPIG